MTSVLTIIAVAAGIILGTYVKIVIEERIKK